MGPLPTPCMKFVELVEILKDANPSKKDTVVLLLQDMLEVINRDIIINEIRQVVELGHGSKDSGRQPFANTDSRPAIAFPPYSYSTMGRIEKESAIDVLINLEARRRIAFFTNSLFTDMRRVPRVHKMLSFSVMSPYNSEDTVYSKSA